MPVKRLKEFLDRQGVKYIAISHSPAYTAQEIAATAHIRGKELAKTVMVKIDGTMAMAVLPASYRVDLDSLREVSEAKTLELATEEEFKGMFPECDVGAMPPFGNLYGEEIAFNAGTHTELIRLSYSDFERLVEPKVVPFSLQN